MDGAVRVHAANGVLGTTRKGVVLSRPCTVHEFTA